MSLITISNGSITLTADSHGAVLSSVQKDGLEYLWQGDPAYWGFKDKNLFPYIGRLTDGKYTLSGKEYSLPLHGFATSAVFEVSYVDDTSVVFTLCEDEETMKMYPFPFVYVVKYEVADSGFIKSCRVYNAGESEMYFALGSHPGFNVPLAEGETFAATSETFFGVGGMGLGWGNSRATWKGALSDVRVWTTARTAEEIAANYNKRLAGNEEGLAVYYPLASAVNNATTEYVSRKPVRVNEGFALTEDATAPLADDPAPALHKAIVLNGADSVNAIGYGIGAGAQESLTLEGWVKPGANGGQIICQGSNNSEGRLRVTALTDRSLSIINNSWNPSGYTSGTDFFPEGEWVHVAVVRDYENAQFRVYRNGELHYSVDATPGSNSGDPVTIATMNKNARPLFDGSLFEMRAWRTARTDAQIKDMYLKRASGKEDGLFVCVHFNEEDSYYGRNVCGDWGVAKSFGSGSVSWTDDPDLPALTYAAETEPSAYFTGNGVTAGVTSQRYTDLESFTFEAWVYPKFLADGNSAYDALCCRAGGSTDEGSFSLGFQYRGSPYMYLKAASGSGQSDQVLAKDIQNACIDRWDHFAFVREKKGDAYEARIYRNGNLLTTVENFSASKIYATDFVIGGRSVTTTGSGFTGAIKDVRVWNKARTAEEITADYAKRLNGREAGLIGYWPLDETNGTTLSSKVRSVSDGGLYAPFVDIPKLTLGEADKSGLVLIFR